MSPLRESFIQVAGIKVNKELKFREILVDSKMDILQWRYVKPNSLCWSKKFNIFVILSQS